MTVAHDLFAINLLSGVEQHVCEMESSDVSVASPSMSVSAPEDFIYTGTEVSMDTDTTSTATNQPPVRKKKKRSSRGSIGKRRHEH